MFSVTYKIAFTNWKLLMLTFPRWRGRYFAVFLYCFCVIFMQVIQPQYRKKSIVWTESNTEKSVTCFLLKNRTIYSRTWQGSCFFAHWKNCSTPSGIRLKSRRGRLVIFALSLLVSWSSTAEKLASPISNPTQTFSFMPFMLASSCFCCRLTVWLAMIHFSDSAFVPG